MKKKIFAVATVIALSISTLCGCGKKAEVETTTTTTVEQSTETVKTTEEPTEVATPTETTEATTEAPVEKVEITDEYFTDYLLTAGAQNVYIKLPDEFNFYPNALFYDRTYADRLTEDNVLTCFMNEDNATMYGQNIHIEYYVVENSSDVYYDLDWYNKNQSTGYGSGFDNEHFEISDTETFDNGITISKITYVYSIGDANDGPTDCGSEIYVCEYKLNDKYSLLITIGNVRGFYHGYNDYDYTENATAIIDFYRNAVSPFVVQ